VGAAAAAAAVADTAACADVAASAEWSHTEACFSCCGSSIQWP
jgi:hypothetical protein